MSRELEAGLDAGAVGLSTGLEYAAEANASGGELYALASVVARRGRLYATHTRDRGLRVVEGTHEAIETTRATGARTQVAHILARRGSGGVEANERIVGGARGRGGGRAADRVGRPHARCSGSRT